MTVFNQKVEKPESEGVWFKFQNSHKDKAVADQIEAIAAAGMAENRELSADDIKLLSELAGKLFIFDEPEEGAAEFRLRRTNPFWEKKIAERKKVEKFIHNPKTRGMERVSYYPDQTAKEKEEEFQDAYDYMIIGMKGARWAENGPEMECTRENKLKLRKDERFDRWAAKCLKTLAEDEARQAEASEKN